MIDITRPLRDLFIEFEVSFIDVLAIIFTSPILFCLVIVLAVIFVWMVLKLRRSERGSR